MLSSFFGKKSSKVFLFAHIQSLDGGKDEFYTGKCNYLHCFRHFLDLCRDSRLFYMSTHMCTLTMRSTCHAHVSFAIDQSYIFYNTDLNKSLCLSLPLKTKKKNWQTYEEVYKEISFAFDRTFDISQQTSSESLHSVDCPESLQNVIFAFDQNFDFFEYVSFMLD